MLMHTSEKHPDRPGHGWERGQLDVGQKRDQSRLLRSTADP